ncbi:response regulator transcription factor [Thiolinea disciformis]|uniref:response regulator transcription factor n=1 Tax=Thiolinea disciformis TaxID=125614 RepID=UPI000381AA1E|nr:response regulator transcription factor [Thiolinea disciformis]
MLTQQTLLLVDDDTSFLLMLKEYIEQEGYQTLLASSAHMALEQLQRLEPDLIILDYMMPTMNGLELLTLLRQQNTIPILMLTARDDDQDRIKGLEMGADDYLCKPFNSRELLARIKAILRRTERSTAFIRHIDLKILKIFPERTQVFWHEQELDLTHTEYKLLELLARQIGFIVSKQELSIYALRRPLVLYDRSIDVHVGHLRAKLGLAPDGAPYIRTIRGRGYQLLIG